METNKKKTKVTHKPHSIRFTDKAIDEMKYRNNFNRRQNGSFNKKDDIINLTNLHGSIKYL